jgi:hypothetical protein
MSLTTFNTRFSPGISGVSSHLPINGLLVYGLARRGLRIGLRSVLDEAMEVRRRVTYEDLFVQVSEGRQRVMLTVQPMPDIGADEGLFLVMFHDVGTPIKPGDTPDSDRSQKVHDNEAKAMLSHMERELATTRDDSR